MRKGVFSNRLKSNFRYILYLKFDVNVILWRATNVEKKTNQGFENTPFHFFFSLNMFNDLLCNEYGSVDLVKLFN